MRFRRERLTGPALALALLLALAGCAHPVETVGTEAATSSTSPSASPSIDPSASPSAPHTTTASPRGLADVPLADGYPAVNGDDQTPVEVTGASGLTDLAYCGRTGWSPGGPVPSAGLIGATYTGEAEDSRARTLAQYAAEADARKAFTALREVVEDCPVERVGGTDQVYIVNAMAAGQEAFLVSHRYRSDYGFDTGLELIGVVRVGDLLLLDLLYGEGGGTPESIAASRSFRFRAAAGVAAAMCALSGDQPCGG